MTSQVSIRPYLSQAYLLVLLMVAVGLTLSPFLMGMSQFWLVLVWLVDALVPARHCGLDPQSPQGRGFKSKLSRFWHNKAAVLLVAFYLMHVVGLLWTSDFQYALKDIRVKLPILVMPFVLSSMEPLERKRFDLVMLVYVLSVFIATLFSFVSYMRHDYEDVREISHFISHIRFCLNIVFCIAIIGWYLYNRGVSAGSTTLGKQVPEPAVPEAPRRVEGPSQIKNPVPAFGIKTAIDCFLQWFLLLWFIYQIYIFESLSGYVILVAVVVSTMLYAFLKWKKGRGWRIAIGVSVLAIVVVVAVVAWVVVKPLMEVKPLDFSTLEKTTA